MLSVISPGPASPSMWRRPRWKDQGRRRGWVP